MTATTICFKDPPYSGVMARAVYLVNCDEHDGSSLLVSSKGTLYIRKEGNIHYRPYKYTGEVWFNGEVGSEYGVEFFEGKVIKVMG